MALNHVLCSAKIEFSCSTESQDVVGSESLHVWDWEGFEVLVDLLEDLLFVLAEFFLEGYFFKHYKIFNFAHFK